MRSLFHRAVLMGVLHLAGSVASVQGQQPDVIQFSSTSYSASENAGSVAVQIERAGRLTDFATVTLRTAPITGGTNDFQALSHTVSFDPGQSNRTVTIALFNDTLIEGAESFEVVLSDPDPFCCRLGANARAVVTLEDNDLGVEFDRAAYAASEASVRMEIEVRRVGDPTNEFSVELEVSGTATAGSDFILSTNRLFFPAGQSNTVTLLVPLLDDPLVEGEEDINLVLTNAAGGIPLGTESMCRLVLHDNEYPSQAGEFSLWFSAGVVSVLEGATNASLNIVRGGNSSATVSVDFLTAGDTPPGSDFLPTSGTLIFQPLETSKNIQIIDDCVVETNRTFQLALTNATSGVTIAQPGRATLVIVDNDAPGSLEKFAPALPATGISLQEDGKVVVLSSLGIARLNNDGSQDGSFPPAGPICATVGIFGTVICSTDSIALEHDGNILAGGIGSLIRLHTNGVRETIASANRGFDFHGQPIPGTFSSLILQPDGKIIVLGNFEQVKGTFDWQWYSYRGLARLGPIGGVDHLFTPPFGLSFGRVAVLQVDGKFVVATSSGLARLHPNGFRDEGFGPIQVNNEIRALVVLRDHRILMGGDFSSVSGQPRPGLARINSSGSLDTNFNPTITAEGFVLRSVQSLTIAKSGTILLSGHFSDGTFRVLTLDSEGAVLVTFQSGLRFPGPINSIIEQPQDGNILVAGNFDSVNGIARPGLARLLGERSHIQLFPPAVQPGGALRIATGSHVGSTYVLQNSTDLAAWTSLATNTATDCTLAFEDPNPGSTGFYRVVKIDP